MGGSPGERRREMHGRGEKMEREARFHKVAGSRRNWKKCKEANVNKNEAESG